MGNEIIRREYAAKIGTTDVRFMNVVAADNGRILNQRAVTGAKEYKERGQKYRIRAELRFDDQCGNGHETFTITGTIDSFERGAWRYNAGGCIHDEIAKHFPDLAPLIKWHLCSTEGLMHYVANTVYHAGDKDHNGRKAGMPSRFEYGLRFGNSPVTHRVDSRFYDFLRNRIGTGDFQIAAFTHDSDPKTYGTHYSVQGFGEKWHKCPWWDAAQAAEFILALNTLPVEFVQTAVEFSEGKKRELDYARNSAVWPEATDAELCADDLADKLRARLPALLADFRSDMQGIGFLYPKARD